MERFEKEQMFQDAREAILAFADCLGRVITPGAGEAMLGLSGRPQSDGSLTEMNPADLDLNRYRFTDVLDDLYDYAFEGKRSVTLTYADCEDTVLFFNGLSDFELMGESVFSQYRLDRIYYMLRVANARFALDDESGVAHAEFDGDVLVAPRHSVLTLSDVALLAGMDEKSVRNAANRNREDRLKTFNHGQGTYVYAEDARAWLAGRRGFRPTVFFDPGQERDLTKAGFHSAAAFGSYIKGHRGVKGMSASDVMNAIDQDGKQADALQSLENGDFAFDARLFARLAAMYGLDAKSFVLAGLALSQRLERSRIEEELTNQAVVSTERLSVK